MTMQLDDHAAGDMRIRLGLAEKWIMAAIAVVLGTVLAYVTAKLDKVDAIDTRTQLMQRDITAIQSNLVDLPQLRSNQIKLQQKVDQLEKNGVELRADVTELQKLKGLR